MLLLLLWFCVGTAGLGPVCGQGNPFELVPRLEREASPLPAAVDSQAAGNPFDLIREAPEGERERLIPAPPSAPAALEAETSSRFRRLKLFIVFGIFFLLAVLLTLLRTLFRKSFQAFLNDTVMNQLYRDQQGRGIFPFLILYSMFFLNAGVFIFFIIKYSGLPQSTDDASLLLFCILGVTGLFLLKHSLLWYLSFTFPIEKEVSRYHFMIIIFSIVIGLFLVPANTMMAYAPEEFKSVILYVSLAIIALIYIFRYLRSLIIANKFLQFHKFHFLLYICSVEIAPVVFLVKLITNQV